MKYINKPIYKYCELLSKREPVPGGGSAAAICAAMGASLIGMVARYSNATCKSRPEKKRVASIIKQSDKFRKQFLRYAEDDVKAYLKVVSARGKAASVKRKALKSASSIPIKVYQLCYQAVKLTPFLVKHGNKNLISDVEIAAELLAAAFNSSMVNMEANK